MIAALPVILQYGIPLIASLVGYIGGRIHQHRINQKPPTIPTVVARPNGPIMPPSTKGPR